MENVQAKSKSGLGSLITNFFKGLGAAGAALGAGLNKLVKLGVEITEAPKQDDDNMIFKFKLPQESDLTVTVHPTGKESKFDISIKGKDTKLDKTFKGIIIKRNDDFTKFFTKFMEDTLGGMDKDTSKQLEDQLTSSIKVGLKKVTSNKDVQVYLTSIMCNDNIPQTLALVDDLINNEDFIESIPDGEQAYEILDDGDDLDVNEIDNVPVTNSFLELLKCASCVKHDLQYIHWNAKGELFADLHGYLDNLIFRLSNNIDTWAELSVEYFGYVPHPSSFSCDESYLDAPDGFDSEQGFTQVKALLETYIQCMDCLACNLDDDVQSLIDDEIRYYKKEANYFISRRLLK